MKPSHDGHARFRIVLLLIGLLAVVWGIAVLVTGGFVLEGPLFRLRSRDSSRAFAVAAVATATYVLRYRRYFAGDAARIVSIARAARLSPPVLVAAALSLATFAIGIHYGSFVAAGSDASGYVSEAELWLQGQLVRPRPAWMDGAPWPASWPTTPLGYQPGPDSRTMVPTYSPGLPLMMAIFQAVGGRGAVFYVVPVLGALGVWATYLLGAQLGNRRVGVCAAVLMFASPAYLFMLVQPMADVPAAAAWALALYFATRLRRVDALLAGFATSIAVLIRPNLVPLAGIIALLVMLHPNRFRRLVVFGVAVAPAVVLIAALNASFFGSPLASGYGPLDSMYSMDRVWPNLTRYPAWLLSSQTPAICLLLASPFLWIAGASRRRIEVVLVTIAFPILVLALYLPYLVFDAWWYLRFLLPGYPSLCIGVAGVIVAAASRIPSPRLQALLPWLIVVPIAVHGLRHSREPFGGTKQGDQRYVRMIDYMPYLPAKSVFVSLTHSGTIHYYTGRDVLRWEGLYDPSYLDPAVDYLRAKGYSVYLVADRGELKGFLTHFAGTRTAGDIMPATERDLGDPVIYALGGSTIPPPP